MKKLFFLSVLLFHAPSHSQDSFKPNGFCSVPVADLLGAPIKSFLKLPSTQDAYKKLPYSVKREQSACPRIAQLIFNEPVEILEKKGDEIKIRVPHLQYPAKNKWHNTYWTLTNNITPLSSEIKKAVPSTKRSSITLRKPVYNPQTHTVYPVGTKFVKKSRKQSRHKYSVYIYDSQSQSITFAHVPKSSCLKTPDKNPTAQQQFFVNLCKEWAHPKRGIIPYVLGGSSISSPLKTNVFFTKNAPFVNKKAIVYDRPSTNNKVCIGIDCARMITRAAQMSGIPFYGINTKALKEALTPLKKDAEVEAGDLVLWTGHVFMISNVEKGLLVEARSYDDGYGKVHEIPYSEQLQGIKTTSDLVTAHFTKPRITRLNRAGKKSHFIYDLEILKFSSIWETTNA
jgi:hypothetical protein